MNFLLKPRVLFFGFILALVFFVFSPCLKAGFLKYWDDDFHLTKNLQCFSLSTRNIFNIFHSKVNQTYIPLTISSYAIEYHFVGLNPFVFHLDNILLHLMVVGLVWILALRLGLSPIQAGGSALIFAIHPMHVESVAWITGRKDLLYSIFYLLALIKYTEYLSHHNFKTYALSLVFAVLSILAKPMALSLPWILWLIDGHYKRPRDFNLIVDKIPFAVLIAPLAWQTYFLHARIPQMMGLKNILIWLWSLTFYIQKFFFPTVLIPLYNLPQPVTIASPDYWQAILIAILCLFLVYRFRQNTWLRWAFLFYIGSIFFLMRYDDVDVSIVADRYMYLPSVGFCLFLGIYYGKLWHYVNRNQKQLKIPVCIISVLLLTSMIFKTYHQSRLWQNDFRFWNYVIAH